MLISLLMAVLAHAEISQYEVASKIIIDGQINSSPRLVIIEGTESSCGSSSENDDDILSFRPVARNEGVALDVDFTYHRGTREISLHTQVQAELGIPLMLPLNDHDSIQITVTRYLE